MTLFLRISGVYFLCAVLVVVLFREEGLGVLGQAWSHTANLFPRLTKIAALAVGLGAVLMIVLRATWSVYRDAALSLGAAVVGTVLFYYAFTLIKTTIPEMVPFWADPLMADVDAWLHGGVDPWRWVYGVAEGLPMDLLLEAYLRIWAIAVLGFMIFLSMLDRNAVRVRRFVILYTVAWIFMGNVLAVAGASVGPVYYDRLLGTARFAELLRAMEAGAVGGSTLEVVQDALWRVYVEGKQALGSGISAFPSVHVSSSVVVAFYLHERLPWIGSVIGAGFVALILFLSVYTGYHYAVDGYASLLVMVPFYIWLRRRDGARARQAAGVARSAPR